MEFPSYREGPVFPSPQLKRKLFKAVSTLAPFYNISREELELFPKPKLIRVLKEDKYRINFFNFWMPLLLQGNQKEFCSALLS